LLALIECLLAALIKKKVYMPEIWQASEYWATRAGCGDKIGKPHNHAHKDHDHKG
jgi:hypothetical protein